MQQEPMDPARQEMLSECWRRFEIAMADKNNIAYSVIQSFNFVVQQSKESTIQAMQEELTSCSDHILN